jgi:hypothetical protein
MKCMGSQVGSFHGVHIPCSEPRVSEGHGELNAPGGTQVLLCSFADRHFRVGCVYEG